MRSPWGRVVASAAIWAAVLGWGTVPADARSALSEAELDATNAAGQAQVIESGSLPGLEGDLTTPLVISQVVGDNQLVTEIRIVIGSDPSGATQVVTIDQSRDTRPGSGPVLKVDWDAKGDLDATAQGDLIAAVVNNLFGANQVTTVVNVSVLMPVPLIVGGLPTTGTGSPGDTRVTPSVLGTSPSVPSQGVSGDALHIGTATFSTPVSTDQLPGIYNAITTLAPALATNPDFQRAVGLTSGSTGPSGVPAQPQRTPAIK